MIARPLKMGTMKGLLSMTCCPPYRDSNTGILAFPLAPLFIPSRKCGVSGDEGRGEGGKEEGGAYPDASSIVREREERHETFPLLSPLPPSPPTFPPTKKMWGGA